MKTRFLALIMSAAMAVTLLPAFSVKAEESSVTGNSGTPEQKVMAEYDMSHADGTHNRFLFAENKNGFQIVLSRFIRFHDRSPQFLACVAVQV